MTKLPHTLLLLAAITHVCLADARSTSRLDVQGEWRNAEIGGSFQKADGCAGFQWLNRMITLEPIPGNPTDFRGVWSLKIVAIWTSPSGAARLKCRWGSELEFRPSSEGLSRQSLTAHLNAAAGTLDVSSRLMDCRGIACNQIVTEEMQKGALSDNPRDAHPFVLTLFRGKLIDQIAPDHRTVFRRTGELSDLMIAAGPTRDLAWQHFDASEFVAFESMVLAGAHPFLDEVRKLREVTGRVVQRATVESFVATGPPRSTSKDETDCILYLSQLTNGDGQQGMEILVLVREESQWKVSLLSVY